MKMSTLMDLNIPKLGFGLMRLPRNEDGTIDVEQTAKMTDMFLDAGLKYFDTAYVYQGSEEAARKALVERHPRDSYYLTSKLNAGAWAAKNKEEALAELQVSLDRTGAGYFDFYLLHALGKDNLKFYDEYDVWGFVREAKEKADNGEKLTEKEQRFVEFLEAYAHARKKPDEVVENALFLSCQDRTIDETITIKRYDPKGELLWIEEKTRKVPVAASVPAQQFYLANKKRKDWEYKPDKSAEQTGDDRKAIILTERGKAKEAKK